MTGTKRVTQEAAPDTEPQINELVCINKITSSVKGNRGRWGGGGAEAWARVLGSAESGSAVICAAEALFLYLLSWF